ncbi:MAG TPA: endopeptidase La, partial [Saprospiraceae bacterium]|nr:endopeptidase La [Saprospiraceae bacterium]
MDIFDKIMMAQGTEEDLEFMPMISLDENEETNSGEILPDILPVLALKNTVLFPGLLIPITVSREKSIKALNKANDNLKYIAVLTQKNAKDEDPESEELYKIGTVAKIVKVLKMPDGTTTAILQGKRRLTLDKIITEVPFIEASIQYLEYKGPKDKMEFQAILKSVREVASMIINLSPNIPGEANVALKNINNDVFLLNFLSSNLGLKIKAKQNILEINDLYEKAKTVLEHLDAELQLLELKEQIETKVRGDIEKQQRDYFLSQQLKTIQDELGQNPQEEEIIKLLAKATKKKWSKEVETVFKNEVNKLKRTNPMVPEYSIMLNYLELMLDLPWNEYTKDNFDLQRVKKVLDQDHFGLEKVKERILEHLAVLKLKGDMKAPILCLVGPPGVGKTSLGKSIGRALKRKFIRMSLGGLHDEAEIRGHRKTYIGAMPGRIIQSLRKIKSANPVFILDELDKVGKDFRGDPSSALLEVLDPEQNSLFYDNYLEIEFDLSKVMFIATANSLQGIQPALLDRMEIIEISGYSIEEKVEIARKHLIPDQRKDHGLKSEQVQISKKVLKEIAQNYTRESGVRSLNRVRGGVMRGVAKRVAMEEQYNIDVSSQDVHNYLGPIVFDKDIYQGVLVPGVTVGLAWTSTGGDILFVESSLNPGKGTLTLTGNLGDVMKESAVTALSFIKAHYEELGIDSGVFEKTDIHVHVPEGAIPKDGPSAGVTMLTALASSFTKKPVKQYLAMTGEITLRGKVLPVGGIKEKILAAKRAGIKEIVLCEEN